MRLKTLVVCLLLGGCSFDSSALPPGTIDGHADTSTPADSGANTDSTDSSLLTDSATADIGLARGAILWTRTDASDIDHYDPSDFFGTSHMVFHTDDLHPDGCRGREVAGIADPAAATWTNYEVGVRIRFDAACGTPKFALVARTAGAATACGDLTGYACTVDLDNNRLIAWHVGLDCGLVARGEPSTTALAMGTSYRLSARVVDSTITCTLTKPDDTTSTATYHDPTMARPAGGVAFAFGDSNVDVGHIIVTAL